MIVVVGGHSRKIGKTSVVCGLIEALPEFGWTALKIEQSGFHELPDTENSVDIFEENGANSDSDSGRFLMAGASRAFWIRTRAGRLAEALPQIRTIVAQAQNVIVESNSLLQFFEPDQCLMVVDGAVADFKPTSLRLLGRADALVSTSAAPLQWLEVPTSLLNSRPHYFAPAPEYRNEELYARLRAELCARRSLAATIPVDR